MNDFDPTVAHAMNQFVLSGIIKALDQCKIISPWDITEQLSLIRNDSGEMSESTAAGLELAQEWVYKEFTKNADQRSF